MKGLKRSNEDVQPKKKKKKKYFRTANWNVVEKVKGESVFVFN
jgi:hypothetical protein